MAGPCPLGKAMMRFKGNGGVLHDTAIQDFVQNTSKTSLQWAQTMP